ncbi:MAG: hypothetical protein RDV48_11660 [Candidatus Eremiobacteraeota bacterium]|nr:hypothetical protein [Candidatus Eremiobacteraeota bacterium]
MKTIAFRILALLGILFLTACGKSPASSKAGAPPRSGEERRDSRFGIDYVFYSEPFYQREEWPRKFSGTGARWVNFAPVSWASIEPQKPRGVVHRYQWAAVDRAVAQWQKHGWSISFTLRTMSGWFAGPIKYRPDMGFTLPEILWKSTDRLPEPSAMPAYRAWVEAMVERYDGDGRDDMPGLRFPILHYQVGNEYANPMFWTGTVEDYETLLRETWQSAKKACPEVKIISNGIRWNDLFHEDPEGLLFEKRFAAFLEKPSNARTAAIWKRARAFTEKTIALAPFYDILDAGGNGPHPSASAGYMSWVRKEMAKTGLKRAIWDMEARCEPQIAPIESGVFHPSLSVPGGKEILEAVKKKNNPGHAKAQEWYRAEQARLLARVFVTRFAAGFEKVFMGMPHDWDGTPAALTVRNPYMGLMDREGKPWAAFYALKLLAEKLDGFKTAEKLPGEGGADLYRFTFPGSSRVVYAAWLREEKVRPLSDPLPAKKVLLKGVRNARELWEIPTTSQEASPAKLEGGGKELIIELTPTPVIIE